MGCFMYCGHAVAVIVVFSCTLAFYCNLHNKLNIHFSFFFLQPSEERNILSTWAVFNCFILISFPRLTPSDARTVNIVMRGTWSGATPLFIMVLLRLAQGQEVPLVPGKTYHISLHWHVLSLKLHGLAPSSWFVIVSVSLCDCLTITCLTPFPSFKDLLLPCNCEPDSLRSHITSYILKFF